MVRTVRRAEPQDPDADGQGALVEVEGGLVDVAHGAVARPHAEACHRARRFLEVPGEVLATGGLLGDGGRLGADGRDRGLAQDAGADGLVHHRRDAAHVVEDVSDAGGREHGRDERAQLGLDLVPRRVVGGAQGAAEDAAARDGVGGVAGFDGAPHEHGSGTRVDLAGQQQGELSDEQAHGLHQVGREVGPGGVAAG